MQDQIDAVDLRVRIAQLEVRLEGLDRFMQGQYLTLETMMKYQAEKVALALTASQTAIDKSDQADEKARDRLAEDMQNRFESVNEFRAQQREIIALFMPRNEFDQFRDRHTSELSELKERMDRSEGKQTGSAGTWAAILGVVTTVVVVVNVIIYALST